MKKLFSLLLVLVMVLSMFTACGGDQPATTDPTTSNDSSNNATEPTESKPSSGKEHVTLSWWLYEDEVVGPIYKAWLAKFHEKYDWITIEPTYLPADTGPEKQTIAYATGTYPDIMGDTYGRLAPAVDAGLTISLEPAIAKIPGLTLGSEGVVKGEHHYIWQGASVGYAVACNMDLAAELGVLDYLPEDGLTWTWDDFLYCLRAAKNAGYYGIDMFAGSQSSDMWYYTWLLSNDVEIADGVSTVLFNKPEYRQKALEVLNLMKLIVDEGLCQPGAATTADVDAQPIWYTGNMLFCHCGWNNSAGYRKAALDGTSVVSNFEMFAIPTKDGRQGGGDSGAFSSAGIIAFDTNNGKNLEAIYETVIFYHSEEGGYFQGTMDASPTGNSILDWVVVDDSKIDPIDKINLLVRGGPYSVQHARSDWGPSCGWYAEFRMAWYPQFSSFLGGYIDAETMLDMWEKNANDRINEYIEKQADYE